MCSEIVTKWQIDKQCSKICKEDLLGWEVIYCMLWRLCGSMTFGVRVRSGANRGMAIYDATLGPVSFTAIDLPSSQ